MRPPRVAARRVWSVAAFSLTAAVVAAGVLHSLPSNDRFPHSDHSGLFPTCLGCHAGIPSGEENDFYSVSAENCGACHDGERAERVEWSPPRPAATSLTFRHPEHRHSLVGADEEPLVCGACHQHQGGERLMEVGRAAPETCIGCHAHKAEAHVAAGTECASCHVALAEAEALTAAAIGAFSEPAGHGEADFILGHAESARAAAANCAFCHARESCSRCHLNAGRLESIGALPNDARVASLLEGAPGTWPEPADHESSDWLTAHGTAAADAIEGCANCHSRPSCAVCHGEAGTFLADLPRPVPGGPAGAMVAAVRPPGHTFVFAAAHGGAAALNLPNCSACHLEGECADCHALAGTGRPPRPSVPSARHEAPADLPSARHEPTEAERRGEAGGRDAPARGEAEPGANGAGPGVSPVPSANAAGGYHPANFVVRHGAEAYAVRSDCTACHSTEVFCRTCHTNVGVGDSGLQGTNAYHNAQPDWITTHGVAARQGMEQCSSCHQQDSCLRCHSAKFGMRINPHGPDFDPGRVADRSTQSCGLCHFGDILERL